MEKTHYIGELSSSVQFTSAIFYQFPFLHHLFFGDPRGFLTTAMLCGLKPGCTSFRGGHILLCHFCMGCFWCGEGIQVPYFVFYAIYWCANKLCTVYKIVGPLVVQPWTCSSRSCNLSIGSCLALLVIKS